MRAIIYDQTVTGARGLLWRWSALAALVLGYADDIYPAQSWADALAWLASHATEQRPWSSVAFWILDRRSGMGRAPIVDCRALADATAQARRLLSAVREVSLCGLTMTYSAGPMCRESEVVL